MNFLKSFFFIAAPHACSCPPPYPSIPISAFSRAFCMFIFSGDLMLHLISSSFSLPIIITFFSLCSSSFAMSFVRLSLSSW